MLTMVDVQQVLKDHVTSYKQQPIDSAVPAGLKAWRWSCSCGQDKTLDTREMCVTETNNHWSAKIVELQPAEELAGDSSQNEASEAAPRGLGILSYVLREIDCERLSMPQGRRMLAEWVQQPHGVPVILPIDVRNRMRRLKQITDAMVEEVSTTLASQSQQNG
jgi:hypothetical protein